MEHQRSWAGEVMMVAVKAGVARFMFDILCHSWSRDLKCAG